MRLFTAILFDDKVKIELNTIKNKIKDLSLKGTFTDVNNLHLTLVFLGEVDVKNIEAIKSAINKVKFDKFNFNLNRLGRFKRDDGDIYWVGIEHNEALLKLQKELSYNLSLLGFEQNDFKPHITLGRRVVLKNGVNVQDSIKLTSDLHANVNKISLMKSERINGLLTYTEI